MDFEKVLTYCIDQSQLSLELALMIALQMGISTSGTGG
jgi:hypothetical protein